MENINKLSCIEINPTSPALVSIICLHGLGTDGNYFVPMISKLDLNPHLSIRFVFPHAPLKQVTINNGNAMRAWYDILSMNIEEQPDKKGINDSVQLINDIIKNENSLGVPHQNIILAGFSQGAVVALMTGLVSSEALGGIIALSSYLPYAEEVLENVTLTARSIPIFMAHGTQDTVIPYQAGLTASSTLIRYGFDLTFSNYPIGHSICEEEILEVARWLQKILI